MDATNAAGLIVAGIAAASAYASQRAAAKASVRNNDSSLEAKRLEQAYERARKFDTETIERQDREIAELRTTVQEVHTENVNLKTENTSLRDEVKNLHTRVDELERKQAAKE